jgi:hypothetical protein
MAIFPQPMMPNRMLPADVVGIPCGTAVYVGRKKMKVVARNTGIITTMALSA